ncbi:hypothetical protein AVEN_85760-1 [Araneus ventricosus]|uniref:Uncharacterized protein n=1 Tax=Araneus ventricosus TaxID=182803 RepID=A0A4Y2N046_ARAVE|nr:hypothetical protein AVEN_85760-1 [Araneus ventricosus]
MKDEFAVRFEQFKTNKSTLAFIVNPLNTNTNEINIEPFGIDAGSLQMQLLDLKTKDLWSDKFTEFKSKLEELEVQKCMHIAQHNWTALKEIPRVEALIFGRWNSLPECYSEVADPWPSGKVWASMLEGHRVENTENDLAILKRGQIRVRYLIHLPSGKVWASVPEGYSFETTENPPCM